ncbi:hypothetical protein C5167_019340 [Papaver somniferum]|uniref:Vesicle-fusing ATPase n=1 Tax=Papaver somniferum TaxID=3469 RepID=A0A4Y7ITV9_PAPSO|nr:hypothetical protein C5167_019340 [Papaver somniferum]
MPPENFNLALLTLDLEFVKKGTKNEQIDAALLSHQLRKRFLNQVMTAGQRVSFEYHGTNYIFTVNQAAVEGEEKSNNLERGMISNDTYFVFEASNATGIKIVNQREAASSNIFRHKEFNLQSLGIGGLSAEFADIFRRAFASRVFPAHVTNKLGIKHVKGMLLYGPPGTGKTLMARQIGQMLNGKDPKIVNGPEVLSKFVGETEKNVRDLFADAENDQRNLGEKSRGSTRDGTGVHDSIVNQLLTKIDGVEALNNVLLIGMTNRKDLLDEALLRPGRLEVQVEISLPDENGRLQILQIHTNKMKENSFLAPDINLQELAARTKNFSGAELEGVVKSAVSYALNRQLSLDDLTKTVDEESIKVTMDDFLHALQEIIPAFGASTDNLERCRLNGVVDCGERHKHIYQRAMLLVEQISAETMIGLSESSKCAQIVKGKNMLVIGTTSEVDFLESLGICGAFAVTYHVPILRSEDAKKVLEQLKVFAEDDIEAAAEALNDMPIKKLYMLIEMAVQGPHGGSAEAIYSGKEKINMSHFFDCLGDIVRPY